MQTFIESVQANPFIGLFVLAIVIAIWLLVILSNTEDKLECKSNLLRHQIKLTAKFQAMADARLASINGLSKNMKEMEAHLDMHHNDMLQEIVESSGGWNELLKEFLNKDENDEMFKQIQKVNPELHAELMKRIKTAKDKLATGKKSAKKPAKKPHSKSESRRIAIQTGKKEVKPAKK